MNALIDFGKPLVAAVQGAAYGLSPYFRLSIATSMDAIKQACDRIEKACKALR